MLVVRGVEKVAVILGEESQARSEEVIIWFFCLMHFSDRPGFAA